MAAGERTFEALMEFMQDAAARAGREPPDEARMHRIWDRVHTPKRTLPDSWVRVAVHDAPAEDTLGMAAFDTASPPWEAIPAEEVEFFMAEARDMSGVKKVIPDDGLATRLDAGLDLEAAARYVAEHPDDVPLLAVWGLLEASNRRRSALVSPRLPSSQRPTMS
jgi:hypothetical protein